MFNKRKKAAELQKLKDLRVLKQEQINAQVEDAGKSDDPVLKVMYLEAARKTIESEIAREQLIISEKVSLSTGRGFLGGAGLAAAGGAIVATVTTAGLGALVAVPLFISGMGATLKRGDQVEKEARAGAQEYLQTIRAQHEHISAQMKDVVKNNVEQISNSSSFGKIMAIEGLAAPFAEAANKHIITAEEAARTIKKKKPAAPRKKQAPDFKDLGGV